METLWIVLASWLIADVGTGIIHWWQDHYLSDQTKSKFLKVLAADNELHHTNPRALTYLTNWENIAYSVYFAVPCVIIMLLAGLSIIWWLPIIFGSFANLIHKWSHLRKTEIPKVIAWVQKTGLFLSPPHHRKHHYAPGKTIMKEDTTERYCPMSDWMNPLLDTIKFFPFLEYCLRLIKIETNKQNGNKI